jgi:hypothetical protein
VAFAAPTAGGDEPYVEPAPGVVVADLNGDGHQDIANGRAKTLGIQIGRGDGSFEPARDTGIGGGPFELATGDVNGDGAPDLVALGAGSVVALLNAGDGHFAKAPSASAGRTAASLVVADFTGDSKLDVALGNSKTRTVDVLPGNGDGSFAAAIPTTTPADAPVPGHLQTGDFNADGRVDLATRRTLLLGAGDGHFDSEPNPLPPGQDQAVGDLNGDGRSDLVALNTVDVTATVVLAAPGGSFSPPQIYATGRGPAAVTLGDFTGDGQLDLITADFLGNRFSVLPGDGAGSFGAATEYGKQTDDLITTFVPGDFDGDRRTDLLLGPNGDPKNVFTAAKSQPAPVPAPPTAKRAPAKRQFAKGGCHPPRDSETIKATRAARMYNAVSGLYACVKGHRLVHLIAERADDYYVKQVQFEGPYVAYAWEGVGAVEGGWYEIALYDLRRGIRIYGPIDPLSVSTNTIGSAYGFTGEGFVRALVLKPNGSLAWTVDGRGAGSSQSVLLMREVWRLDSHGRELLDHGGKIAPKSLALKGSRLTWRKGGQTASAALR